MRENIERAIALMEQLDFLKDQISRTSELRERLYGRELIISVIGQFKRGKSSLINALLGDKLLPVGIIPLTTVVTEIRQGDNFRAVARFADGSERETDRNNLPNYISEQKNPGNHKNVAMVKLWTEHNPFGPGITLVDTPGVGSVHQHNTQASNAYIEKSDAVLFLLSVDSPVSEIERNFLLEAREHAAKFYFAVNKIDTISADNLKEFLSYCKVVLSEAIGWDVTLYPLSAQTGEGVSLLSERLAEDLRVSHDELLNTSVSIKLDAILEQANTKITLYLKAAAIPADELKDKLARIRERQTKLSSFSDEAQVLTRQQTKRLVERIRESLDTKITELQPEIEIESGRLFEEFAALPSRQFEPKMLGGLENIVRDRLAMLNAEGLAMLDEGYAAIAQSLNERVEEMAQFISDMVKDQFGADYPIFVKEFSVSERNDFFIRISPNKNFLPGADAFTHLLSKSKANKHIYARAVKQTLGNLHRNKNNMVYNYGYKMQESLRTLCGELVADILQMSTELDGLLRHVEQNQDIRSEELRHTEEKLRTLAQQLEQLRGTRNNTVAPNV